jgi:hypothetical protein
VTIVKILFLLLLANGTPVIVAKLMGRRLAHPVDCGKIFADGRPWFGPSKTVRGIVLSIMVTTIGAVLLGYTPETGAIFATASMAGDLCSSFIKRRLNLAPSSQALGLDQIPESLLPLLVCWRTFGLDPYSVAAILVLFFLGELVLSKVLFRMHVRDRPY